MTNMQLITWIVNWCRSVKAFVMAHHNPSLFLNTKNSRPTWDESLTRVVPPNFQDTAKLQRLLITPIGIVFNADLRFSLTTYARKKCLQDHLPLADRKSTRLNSS